MGPLFFPPVAKVTWPYKRYLVGITSATFYPERKRIIILFNGATLFL
jgi:hypothetical protein